VGVVGMVRMRVGVREYGGGETGWEWCYDDASLSEGV
jgi:hypothetical protein